jgi:plastocyanin
MGAIFAFTLPAKAILYEVEIEDFSFIPARLNINVGDMVEWRNRDGVIHTSTSDNGVWDSGPLAEDETYTYTFTLEGVYPYHCSPHPWMVDTIVVGTPTGIDDRISAELSQSFQRPDSHRILPAAGFPCKDRRL